MWIDKPEDEESTNQPIDTGEGPSVGAGAGGSAPIQSSTTAAVGTPSSTSPTPDAPGQKFGTIQDYFKGSKTQGEKLGQEFTGKLDATKQQQQNAIQQAAAGAESQVAANTIGFNQDLVSKAASDPTKITGDEDQYDQFMQQWNAAYRGPQNFEASDQYGDAAKATKVAQDKATQASSTGGRQQILQDEFGVYGQGNKGLDEALLQQSSSFGTVGEKANELNSLQDYLASQSQAIQGKAQEAKTTTEQTKQAARDALVGETGAIKQFKTDIDARTEQERASADKSAKDLEAAIASNANLTDQQLSLLGVTRDQYTNLLRQQRWAGSEPNLKDYFTAYNPAATIGRENVATAEDFAKDEAFAKLTGGSKLLGQAAEQGKLVDFDKDKALQDYLDSTNADQATRDAARREREAAQAEEAARVDAERTAKREDTQNRIVGGAVGSVVPGVGTTVGALLPGVGNKISEIIGKDKTASTITSTIGQGINKITDVGKKIFGGGKKDAVVNLPTLKLPDVEIPMNADLKTTQAIKKIFTEPLNMAGSYHEGAAGDMIARLSTLKKAYDSKQISPEEYNAYAQPLAKWTENALHTIMGASSQAANAARPLYNLFMDSGFRNPVKETAQARLFSDGGLVEPRSIQDYLKQDKR